MKIFYTFLWAVAGILATTAPLNAEVLECLTVKPANDAGYSIRVTYSNVCENGKDVGERYDDLSTAFHAERQVKKGSSVDIWTQAGPFNNADLIKIFVISAPTLIWCTGVLPYPTCDSKDFTE